MVAKLKTFSVASLVLGFLTSAIPAAAQSSADARMERLRAERLRAAEAVLLASGQPLPSQGRESALPAAQPDESSRTRGVQPGQLSPEAWQEVRRLFAVEGVPEELLWLGWVESRFDVRAVSSKGARGLWQLMPETARQYGLEVSGRRDERSELLLSTRAAARYLADLHRSYGDWLLVLAAYNAGPRRLEDALARAGSPDFWRLQRWLPEEAQRYVPAVLAAMGSLPGASNAESSRTRQREAVAGARVFALLSPPSNEKPEVSAAHLTQ